MYRMILVDDEPQIRRGLEGLIPWEDYGIELVGEADNGVSAKILIERVRPDIAIVDIRMPQMDGLQLLAQAKELTSCPKFIMLSGFDQFDYVRTAMRLGAKKLFAEAGRPGGIEGGCDRCGFRIGRGSAEKSSSLSKVFRH